MGLLQAVILAVIQGATEFLPVSSSGHLALASKLLGLAQAPLDFVVAVHFGTLLSVVIYYRRDLCAMLRSIGPPPAGQSEDPDRPQYRKLFWLLLLGTVPAAIAGYFLEDTIDAAFGDIRWVGAGLIFTAALLAIAARLRGRKELPQTGWKETLAVGVAQALALPPGVSRSGCTIVGALLCGLKREWAPRFAFLLSVPIILGGSLLQLKHILEGQVSGAFDPVTYSVAVAVAAVSGYAAIFLVTDSVKRGNLLYFAAYCLALGVAATVVGSIFHV